MSQLASVRGLEEQDLALIHRGLLSSLGKKKSRGTSDQTVSPRSGKEAAKQK